MWKEGVRIYDTPGVPNNFSRLFISNNPIGVGSLANAIESFLDIESNDIWIVGIHGLGGIGMTTVRSGKKKKFFKFKLKKK